MEKIEMIRKLRIYMDEANGKGAWKLYVGSQLEEDIVNFIMTNVLQPPHTAGDDAGKTECKHPIEKRDYIGNNTLRCRVCRKEFS